MTMSNPTNLQVWQYGEVLEHYPCDVDANGECETNGSVEHLMELDGKKYSVITDWENNPRWPEKDAVETHDGD